MNNLIEILTKAFGRERYAKVIICLVLLAFGITKSEINKKFGTTYPTLRKYKSALDNGNLEDLLEFKSKRTKSELDKYESLILKDFDENPPKTLREAQTRIEQLTELKRSLNRIRVWLKKKGLRSRSVGFLPAKADSKKQKDFLENTLKPLIENAKSSTIELFFMDASHFVMGGFAGRVWSVARKYIKTASGRQRYNVLGALNFVSKKIETVCNDSYITSTQVIELLEKLAESFDKPIKIILDNARYQRCNAVTSRASDLGIELIFLPTYSPNLNLIERVWKIVKSMVLNSAYYETFDSFSVNILECVNTLHSKCATQMASSVTENFQIIEESPLVSK